MRWQHEQIQQLLATPELTALGPKERAVEVSETALNVRIDASFHDLKLETKMLLEHSLAGSSSR